MLAGCLAGRREAAPDVERVLEPARHPCPSPVACRAMWSGTAAYRRGETQIPSQPSPSRRGAADRAASDRPPTTSGIAGAGAGRISASSSAKNSPSKLTGVPSARPRRIRRHSSVRRPRVVGSTPQTSISWRSSPPTPTPSVSRPGASCAIVASWRATGTGWRNGSRYSPTYTGQRVLRGEQGGRVDQPVGTRADEEADVITDAQVVDARVGDPTERRAPGCRIAVGRFERVGEEPDADRRSRIGRSDPCAPDDEGPDDRRHGAPRRLVDVRRAPVRTSTSVLRSRWLHRQPSREAAPRLGEAVLPGGEPRRVERTCSR